MLFSALILALISCNGPKLWGQSREELLSELGKHDYSFIDTIDTSRYSEILKLGPEAPWYIALHFTRAGRVAEGRAMLAVGAADSPEPFKTMCAQELTRTGTAAERLAAVETILSQKDPEPPIDVKALEALRIDLLIELGRFDDIPGGLPAWFYTHPVSERFSGVVASLNAKYPSLFLEIAGSRVHVYRREYQAAWLGAKPLLASGAPECFQRSVLSDFGKAALYGSVDPALDAAFFDQLSAVAAKYPDSRYMLAFYAGRLYAAAATKPGLPAKASGALKIKSRDRFESAMILAATDSDYDTALWYTLDASSREGTDSLVADISRYARNWKNPALFSDLLDTLIVQLVRSGDWKRIVELRSVLPENADQDIRIRLEYLSARSGILSPEETNVAFTAAFSGDHGSLYYRALSAEALGIALGSPESVIVKRIKSAPGTMSSDQDISVLRGYLTYRLPELLYSAAARLYQDLPVSAAVELGRELSNEGLHGDALRLMLLALKATDTPITDDDLKLIYPRPWLETVSAASDRFGVPAYLVYALMRTESYFQDDVVSTAGAVGLTQLMKPTAGDIARKLKVAEYDLTDPATNITFGAFYLSELAARLEGHVLPALFAYNAGISRVRLWQKTAGGLSMDLFLETLPYAETREYGRKVLAASAVYGYLYYQKNIGQIVRESF